MNISIYIHSGDNLTTLHAQSGINLHKALCEAGYAISSPCGGAGWCGKCIVRASGALSEPNENELKKLDGKSRYRLACQTTVLGNCEVWLSESKAALIQTNGSVNLTLDPHVKACKLHVPKDTRATQKCDASRFSDAYFAVTGKNCELPLSVMSSIKGEDICAVLYDNRVLNIMNIQNNPHILGVAVDIGTTTVVAYLYDLMSGKRLGICSGMNVQKKYGDDVISRMSYCESERNGLKTLSKAIRTQLNGLISSLCADAGCKTRDIYHICVAGNTVMEHIFAGLDPIGISRSPFTPVSLMGFDEKASEYDIISHENAVLSLLPCIAGYVGGDITAGIFASDIAESDMLSLFVDIGTNGEMAFGNAHRLLTCAVAAGPAFEGGRITYGMNGVEGAISRAVASDDGINVSVIGGGKAVGICGSGLVDLVATALKIGVIDESGRMVDVDEASGIAAALLSEDSGMRMLVSDGVYLTESDIRQLQLAKSAIMAGIETIVNEYGAKIDDIDRLYLAGGFGNYIDRQSAADIGLLPKTLAPNAVSLGNAAGMGAIKALLDRSFNQKMSDILAKTEYIELSGNAHFNDAYIDNMMFE